MYTHFARVLKVINVRMLESHKNVNFVLITNLCYRGHCVELLKASVVQN